MGLCPHYYVELSAFSTEADWRGTGEGGAPSIRSVERRASPSGERSVAAPPSACAAGFEQELLNLIRTLFLALCGFDEIVAKRDNSLLHFGELLGRQARCLHEVHS